MDNNSSVPSFEIPKTAEQEPGAGLGVEKDQSRHEVNKEMLPAPVQGMPSVSAQPIAGLIPTSSVATQATVPSDDMHLIADDSDVIEKEWVDRAKKIVAATSHDPFLESQELSKLKARYMKKRFDKDIPIAGDSK